MLEQTTRLTTASATAERPKPTSSDHGTTRATTRTATIIIVLAVALLPVSALSLSIGSGPFGPADTWRLLTGHPVDDSWILLQHRLPRTLLGLLVGAALATSGLLMQALTRNPLADPGLLGVNAGAAAAVATCITVGITSVSGYIWFAFLGAGLVSVAVYLLGSQGRSAATPERLVLAGAALSAVLTAYSGALVLTNATAFDEFRFWQVGALADRDLEVVVSTAPFVLLALLGALVLAWPLNALALGDDIGRALGAKVVRTRAIGALLVTMLCGAATAAAGPIAFLGLAVPHVARGLLGPDLRPLVPVSALLGANGLLLADVLGRVLGGSGEVEVGIVTAALGAPVFIALVRGRRPGRL